MAYGPHGEPPNSHPKRGAKQHSEAPETTIVREMPWSGRLEYGRAHVAVVLLYRRGDHQVIWPHDRQRVQLSRRPTTVYEVDIALHHFAFETKLPSSVDGCPFHAAVSIQWRILDPSAVVRHRVGDFTGSLIPELKRRMRHLSRTFDIADWANAEDRINTELAKLGIEHTGPDRYAETIKEAAETGYVGADYGLWTRATVHLTPDEAALDHHTKMTRLNWAIEEEQAEQELRILQEKNRRAIMDGRIKVYRQIIAAGDIERFALQLANNPDDITAIAEIMLQEQQTSRRDTIDFVAHLVDSGVIERWEVGDHAREVLQSLKEVTARVLRNKDNRSETEEPAALPRRRGRRTSTAGEPETMEGVVINMPSYEDSAPDAAGTPDR